VNSVPIGQNSLLYVDETYIPLRGKQPFYIDLSMVTMLVASAFYLACFAGLRKGSAEPGLLLICSGLVQASVPVRVRRRHKLRIGEGVLRDLERLINHTIWCIAAHSGHRICLHAS
jgi:hypothetical protein